ncbi:hypothetical protein ACLQ24_16460 [Micromonospora sp. DT4]|uniref:hypothetical protein n=1 Tax=Micromonospora sp. DT4 TaxID=3393438 RepID=UPI003CF83550
MTRSRVRMVGSLVMLAALVGMSACSLTIEPTPAASWTVDREGGAEVTSVTVFELPSGWTVDEQTLVAFDPAVEYSAAAYGTQRDAIPVHFTLDGLTALGPGDVLVGEAAGKRKAVTETAFRKRAKKTC